MVTFDGRGKVVSHPQAQSRIRRHNGLTFYNPPRQKGFVEDTGRRCAVKGCKNPCVIGEEHCVMHLSPQYGPSLIQMSSVMKEMLAEEQARNAERALLGIAVSDIPKGSVGFVYGLSLFDEPVIPCDLPDTFQALGLDPERDEPEYKHEFKMDGGLGKSRPDDIFLLNTGYKKALDLEKRRLGAGLVSINDVKENVDRAQTIARGEMGRVFGLPVVQSEFVRPGEMVIVKDTSRTVL